MSPLTNAPEVMVYSNVGSASPYVFDTAVAVTVMARSITVIVFATDDAALKLLLCAFVAVTVHVDPTSPVVVSVSDEIEQPAVPALVTA